MTGDAVPAPVFQVDRLASTIGGDSSFICEVLASFRAAAPGVLSAMAEAADRGDAKALAAAAHKLKGSCRTIGAEALARTCELLETQAVRPDVGSAAAPGTISQDAAPGGVISELLMRAVQQHLELVRVLGQHCPDAPRSGVGGRDAAR